jgi:Fe-S-cluster containining protein
MFVLQPKDERMLFPRLGQRVRVRAREGKITAMNGNSPADFVLQLCPKCGQCCNGVLFADVELGKGDDTQRLAELGLTLKKKGSKPAFAQPCVCFDGTRCRIYAERPAYCRAFECGLLKRVQAGGMEAEAALGKIDAAQQLAEKVRQLLRGLGDKDEQLALTRRYAQAMREPVDLSGSEDAVELRGELMLAVNDLMQTLQRDFLK